MPIRDEITRAIADAAERGAQRAVEGALVRIGVDISSPEAAREFQHDLIWLRELRKFVEQRVLWWSLLTVASTLGAIVIAAVATVVKHASQ